MANRNNHLSPSKAYEPRRCWVGDTHKIIYDILEEAELAAKVAAYDHGIQSPLKPYKCPSPTITTSAPHALSRPVKKLIGLYPDKLCS